MPYLLLLFIAMPIVEIAILIQVGSRIGVLPTLAIVIATAVIGTGMLRRQGTATLAAARQRLDRGEVPTHQLVEGVLLLIGGVLLLTPGFVTDAFGFACLIPASRHWLARSLGRNLLIRAQVSGTVQRTEPRKPAAAERRASRGADPTAEPRSNRRTGSAPGADGEVIDGDYRRID